ncbi:AMP-binding protein, partial [Thauera sinica]
ATMERMMGGWQVLLEAMLSQPDVAVSRLAILPEAERAQVVDGWNATHRPYALEQGTARLIEAQAARTPQAVALQQDETSLTYAELDARANRLAHHLRTLGVGPDVRVAVCLGRSVELVVAELAVLKAGGAYVPLDPAYPGERLAYMLEDCEPGVILTDGGLEAELQTLIAIAAARHEPALPVLDLRQDGAWRDLPEGAVTVAGLRPHHLAYVIYTSGSTGRPKGVMIEQR